MKKVGPADGSLSVAEMRVLRRKRRKGGRHGREDRGDAEMENLDKMRIQKMFTGEVADGRENLDVKWRTTGVGAGYKVKVSLDSAAGRAGRTLA